MQNLQGASYIKACIQAEKWRETYFPAEHVAIYHCDINVSYCFSDMAICVRKHASLYRDSYVHVYRKHAYTSLANTYHCDTSSKS